MYVLSRLRELADTRGDRPALDDGSTAVTWAELHARVRSAAATLAERGVRPGDRVALVDGAPVGMVTWFLAVDWRGAAALIDEPTWTEAERSAVYAAAAPAHVIDSGEVPVPASDEAAGSVENDDSSFFYLGTTSGSTGGPKVYTRTRRSWHESFDFFTDAAAMTEDDTVFVPRGLATSGTLFAVIHAITVGARCLLSARWSASESAKRMREATVAYQIPAMLTGLLAEWAANDDSGGRTRIIFSGGAKLDRPLADRVRMLLPDCRLIEYYGSSEHSLIAMGDGEFSAAVGTPPSTVEIEIRDGAGKSLPVGAEGEIWVRSPMVFAGYLTGGSVTAPPSDWISVGDRGLRSEDGALIVRGRGSATVITGGAKVSAEEVESVLRNGPGVAEAVVIGLPHERFGSIVAAILQPLPGERLDRPALRAHVAERLNPNMRPRRWLAVPEIPMTTTGKVARAAVIRQLDAGALGARSL